MKHIYCLIFLIVLFESCKEEKSKIVQLPSDSIFNLASNWRNQNNDTLQLKRLQGKTMVVVMIYTTCKFACPILVADMKKIEKQIKPSNLKDVSMVLVSIDPKTDTPERLAEFAKTSGMEADHWVFLRSNEADTQEFANVLAMKYKKISPVDFSHSNIISIFNKEGKLIMQEEGLEIDVAKVAGEVNKLAKSS